MEKLVILSCFSFCTGEGVVLQDDLMDDSTAGLPEADSVLGSGRGEEVVDFFVEIFGALQILLALNLGLDQMVTVDGGGNGHLGQSRGNELEHRHLSGSVLHGHTVRAES